jgi:Ni/Co efflux regulator RcnB
MHSPILSLKLNCALALLAGGILASAAVIAQSPGWAGPDVSKNSEERQARENDKSAIDRAQQKGGDQQKSERRDQPAPRSDQIREPRDADPAAGPRGQFDDRLRLVVRDYYEENYRGDRCPPGLAKKHNGCMPAGTVRRWQYGHPLARNAIYYEVPRPLVLQIGAPPSGYRYVRVATDILLIAIGTGMVVDAIEDLGRS